jgi:hypothetical protein
LNSICHVAQNTLDALNEGEQDLLEVSALLVRDVDIKPRLEESIALLDGVGMEIPIEILYVDISFLAHLIEINLRLINRLYCGNPCISIVVLDEMLYHDVLLKWDVLIILVLVLVRGVDLEHTKLTWVIFKRQFEPM